MLTALDQFMAWTAWPMEKPPAYGLFHISVTVIGFALSVLLAWKLRKLDDKGNRRLLLGIGIILAICEAYKQLFYYSFLRDHHYEWGILPFHLCSVPMYLCIIAPLLKPGKVQKAMYSFMMMFNLLGGGISFAEPSGLLHDYWTLTIHANFWHMSLVFIGLYLAFSGRGGTEKKDYKGAAITFVCLCAIAFCINLATREVSGGSVNMFFVGPSNSSLIVFKQISEMFGWYVSTLLYIPSVCLGAYLVFLPIHLHAKKKAAA